MSPSREKSPIPTWLSFDEYLKTLTSPPSEAPHVIPTQRRLLNRDLSWLQFNERVLREAADDTVPALERLRFAGIVSSNLDEFFMVRVAEISKIAKRNRRYRFPDGSTSSQTLSQIRDQVLRQKSEQAAILRELVAVLAKEGILLFTEFRNDPTIDKEVTAHLPSMKVIVRPWSEPLPPLLSERIHVFVRFPERYAVISIENRADRLVQLSPSGRTLRFALIEQWLTARAQVLFPNQEVIEAFPFKIIRDADLRYRPDDEETLESQIVQAVEHRSKARVVRLEVDAPHYSEGALFLASSLGLDSAAIYRFDLPLDLRTLATLYNLPGFSRLRYPPVKPQRLKGLLKGNLFRAVQQRDILLQHPYDSFDTIVKFLQTAARDPDVLRIFHTVYRTSQQSPIMEALKEAAHNGKKVTAYIEIKARFDELNNVRWADELRRAGVRVVRPLGGFKVHCKLTQIVRLEKRREVSYLHLGTGNYHPGTALQYTDLGLLTKDLRLGQEITSYFAWLSHRRKPRAFDEIMVAPSDLHDRFLELIRDETRIQQQGGKGHIIAKMNALVDLDIIEALYAASQAGVRIELIVRGICCLRPGVKGVSENIRVISVIDRFLEHSRIYYFRANGTKKIFLGSADWMPRNFHARYEVAFPVKDPVLKKYIREIILATSLAENVKGWILRPDGTYDRIVPSTNARLVRSQFVFEQLARDHYRRTMLAHRPKTKALTPA